MKTIKTLTLILFPLLFGLFIGSAINNDSTTCVWSLILLGIDIIAGIISEYLVKYWDDENDDNADEDDLENNPKKSKLKKIGIILFVLQAIGLLSTLMRGDSIFGNGFANAIGRFSFAIVGIILFFVADRRKKETREEDDDNGPLPTPHFITNAEHIRRSAAPSDEATHTTKVPLATLCEFHRKTVNVLIHQGTKLLDRSLFFSNEGYILINVCAQMEFKPHIRFTDIHSVDAEIVNGLPALIYGCHFDSDTIAENAMIILIATEEKTFRLFTVETHQRRFFLCEYPGNGHILHDEVLPEKIQGKIEELLKNG